MQNNPQEVKYSVQGMDCADCALSLERSLAQIKGVEQVSVNFTTGYLEANGSFDPQEVIARVKALGYKVARPGQVLESGPSNSSSNTTTVLKLPGFLGYLYASTQTRMALLGAILLVLSIPLALIQGSEVSQWLKNGMRMLRSKE